MKTPLRYQLSEFDCGPSSLLNGISYLFDRDEIPPDIIRSIMLYCLDGFGSDGIHGKTGTSATAMMYLTNFLNAYGRTGRLPISAEYFSGSDVHFHENSPLIEALRSGGVVVQRLYLEVGHYALLTGMADGKVLCFDPYYEEEPFSDPEIVVVEDHPDAYNRILPTKILNSETQEDYALGAVELREAVVLFNNSKRN